MLLAVCLSAIAGDILPAGVCLSWRLFVSFMSGNPTRLGVKLAASPNNVATAAYLSTTFVLGAILGSHGGRAPTLLDGSAPVNSVPALLSGSDGSPVPMSLRRPARSVIATA